MNELALRDPAAVALRQPDAIIQRSGGIWERDIIDGWIEVLEDVSKLANFIAETDFVPRALRNRPAAVAACILTGRELGIGPMQSLKAIHMVQGVPSLSAEYKRARALAAGHEIVFDDTNGTRCVIRGRRANSDRWVTVQWNMDMARRAKLASKDVWQQYPQRMLQARASSELCDILFPDASLGLATMEVLEDGGIVTESGERVDAATGEITSGPPAIEQQPAADPKPRTAQRRTRTQAASPAQTAAPPSAPAPSSPSAQGAGEALPPLPGEEEDPTTSGASSSAHAPDSASREGTGAPSPSSPDGSASSPDETDYDTPGTATTPQKTALWTILSQVYKFGADEKDQARGVCAHIVNRDLKSSSDLSKNEAKTVLDTLSHWQEQAKHKGEEPRDYLIAVMVAQDTADGAVPGE